MLDFVKGLLCIYWNHHMIFIFNPFTWVITFSDLTHAKLSLYLWDKADHGGWSFWHVFIFGLQVSYWDFAFMFMRDIGLSLLSYFYLVLVLKHTDFVGRVWKRSFCFIFLKIIQETLVVDFLWKSGRVLLNSSRPGLFCCCCWCSNLFIGYESV